MWTLSNTFQTIFSAKLNFAILYTCNKMSATHNVTNMSFWFQAYSVYDDEVGYCQGLSFLAAALLIHVSTNTYLTSILNAYLQLFTMYIICSMFHLSMTCEKCMRNKEVGQWVILARNYNRAKDAHCMYTNTRSCPPGPTECVGPGATECTI